MQTDLSDAIKILQPNIVAHLNLYRVNQPDEMAALPGALVTSRAELRALAFVIAEVQRQAEELERRNSEAEDRLTLGGN